MNTSTLSNLALQILRPLALTVLTWLFGKLGGLVHHQTAKIKNQTLRAEADIAVQWVEQTASGVVSNPEKKARALTRLQTRFPKLPVADLDAVIEAAVLNLPKSGSSSVSGVASGVAVPWTPPANSIK